MTSTQSTSAVLRGKLRLAADPRSVFEVPSSQLLQTPDYEIPVNLQQNIQSCIKSSKVGWAKVIQVNLWGPEKWSYQVVTALNYHYYCYYYSWY